MVEIIVLAKNYYRYKELISRLKEIFGLEINRNKIKYAHNIYSIMGFMDKSCFIVQYDDFYEKEDYNDIRFKELINRIAKNKTYIVTEGQR